MKKKGETVGSRIILVDRKIIIKTPDKTSVKRTVSVKVGTFAKNFFQDTEKRLLLMIHFLGVPTSKNKIFLYR